MVVLVAVGIATLLALVSYGLYRLNYKIGYAAGFMSVLFTLMMINALYQAEVHGPECDWLFNCDSAMAVKVDSIVIIPDYNRNARTCFSDSFTISKTMHDICSAQHERIISRYGTLIRYAMILYYDGKKLPLKLTKDTGDVGIQITYSAGGAELMRLRTMNFYFVLNDGTLITQ